jgi:predicted aldo/keto reductase-like oxidoreductase
MSTLEQVEQNARYAARATPGCMRPEERAVVHRVRDEYRSAVPIPCTQCKYCLPCPHQVAIPRILELYNEAVAFADVDAVRERYTWIDEESRAARCKRCGDCEERCPQKIAIVTWLERAQSFLALGEE